LTFVESRPTELLAVSLDLEMLPFVFDALHEMDKKFVFAVINKSLGRERRGQERIRKNIQGRSTS